MGRSAAPVGRLAPTPAAPGRATASGTICRLRLRAGGVARAGDPNPGRRTGRRWRSRSVVTTRGRFCGVSARRHDRSGTPREPALAVRSASIGADVRSELLAFARNPQEEPQVTTDPSSRPSPPVRLRALLGASMLAFCACGTQEPADAPPSLPDRPADAEIDRSPPHLARDRGTNPYLGWPAPPRGTPPSLQVAAAEQSLPPLTEGDVVDVWFWMRNGGSSPLHIRGIKPSCNCTSDRLLVMEGDGEREIRRGDPIPGGASVLLHVLFDTLNEPGERRVSVRLFSDDPTKPETTVRFAALVEPWAAVEPETVELPSIVPTLGATATIRIASRTDEPFDLLPKLNLPQGYELLARRLSPSSFDIELRIAPHAVREVYTIKWTMHAQLEDGSVRPFLIPVYFAPGENHVVEPAQVDFGELVTGVGAEQAVTVRSHHPNHSFTHETPRVLSNRTEFLEVRCTPPEESGAQGVDVLLTLLPECPPGRVSGSVLLTTNLPDAEELRIPFFAVVAEPDAP